MDPEIAAARLSVSSTQELTLEVNALNGAMKGIPETPHDAVRMAGDDGMTYENIAARLNIPIGTIKSRISREWNDPRYAKYG
jgi:DNA-directed RNA polymerase specialized sigma24 family protein